MTSPNLIRNSLLSLLPAVFATALPAQQAGLRNDSRADYAAEEAASPDNRFDPSRWELWRCAPMPFPSEMEPLVPESAGTAIDFGKWGDDLTIVTPDRIGTDYEGRALEQMVSLIRETASRATVVGAGQLTPGQRQKQLIVVGTPGNNALARLVLGATEAEFMKGIPPGGYHLKAVPSPFSAGRSVILALGADSAGAWPVAGILAFAIHPAGRNLVPRVSWPYALPTGTSWAPFEARYTLNRDAVEPPPIPSPAPAIPRIPFGVRIWGSPMPTLESFQRLIRALKPLGINTVAIQGGGWPDLPNAAELYRSAVDLAWREGIFTIVYVGNEMKGHHPAPLTPNHKAIVLAVKDLPGLLEWHLYNQLTADFTPAENRMVEEQMRWLTGVSGKPVGAEVVWGHDTIPIPAAKVRLIGDLKRWGMSVVASDDAPIGGWSRHHDMGIWEPRFLQLERFGLPTRAVIQTHVPFIAPQIPSAAEVRSQYWWAAAGGARGFLFETAYLYTHLSMRGILSWDLRPFPDGRYDEIRRLARINAQIEPMLADTRPGSVSGIGLPVLAPGNPVALRLRLSPAGRLYVLLINPSLESAARATLLLPKPGFAARELAPGGSIRESGPDRIVVDLAPGDGTCLQLARLKP